MGLGIIFFGKYARNEGRVRNVLTYVKMARKGGSCYTTRGIMFAKA